MENSAGVASAGFAIISGIVAVVYSKGKSDKANEETRTQLNELRGIVTTLANTMELFIKAETARSEFVSKELHSVTNDSFKKDIQRLQEADDKIFKLLETVHKDITGLAVRISEKSNK